MKGHQELYNRCREKSNRNLGVSNNIKNDKVHESISIFRMGIYCIIGVI